MADGFLAGMNFIVSDTPAGGGAAGAMPGAGGFVMGRDEMDAQLTRLQELRRRIDQQQREAVPLWTIQSPGEDPASLRNTEAANNSGRYYLGHLQRQSGYVSTIIEKMQRALGVLGEADEQAGKDIAKQDGGRF